MRAHSRAVDGKQNDLLVEQVEPLRPFLKTGGWGGMRWGCGQGGQSSNNDGEDGCKCKRVWCMSLSTRRRVVRESTTRCDITSYNISCFHPFVIVHLLDSLPFSVSDTTSYGRRRRSSATQNVTSLPLEHTHCYRTILLQDFGTINSVVYGLGRTSIVDIIAR